MFRHSCLQTKKSNPFTSGCTILSVNFRTSCLQTKKSNPFTSGCTNFCLSTLERHVKSKQQLILYLSFYSQNVYTNPFILTPKVKEMALNFGD